MSSFQSLLPLGGVRLDPRGHELLAAVQPVVAITPLAAVRRTADGLPEAADLAAVASTQPATQSEREQAALDEINQSLALASIGLQFEFDKEADQMIARVVDTLSGEVIRQMPSEEVLHVAKMLDKLQGLIFQHAA